ncbi:MAG: DUF4328 domain-containing protein [Actinomycetota bacterium]|nr:DUF4328 domain-containing protein [Actinomycetota bacterium]
MNMPPPPPPSGPFPTPPSGSFPTPPPGYVPYGAGAQMGAVKPSKGLSKAMIILYGCATAAGLITTFGFFKRKGIVDDYQAGDFGVDLKGADSLIGGGVILQFMLVLSSAIVTCLWARRIASNAQARGVAGLSPGLAAGGWFIPFGWYVIGFNQLRKSAAGVGGATKNLAIWQGLFIAQSLLGFYNLRGDDVYVNDSDAPSRLRNQGIVALVGVLFYLGATLFASKAAKDIDGAVTGG